MPKNSAYLARQAARQRALTDEVRRYTIQQCGDFMLLAAAEAFGFGEDRLKRLSDAWATKFDEYADLLIDDLKGDKDFEYTKAIIDRQLQQACGKYFQPWEERYYGR